MPLARLASFVHKWLALLVGVQIVFWVASGLFFTLFPIQQIRSENLIRPAQAQTLDTATLASLGTLHGDQAAAPTKLTIERRATRQSSQNLPTHLRSCSTPARFSVSHRLAPSKRAQWLALTSR